MKKNINEKLIAENNQSISKQTKSLWMDVPFSSFPPLQENLKCDVCIVGSGIAGLTCAYHLAKKGKSVVVLEREDLIGGQSARTTAHLSWVLDHRFSTLKKYFGMDGIITAAQSHAEAINTIEKIVKEENIDCDWERVDGYLFPDSQRNYPVLEEEYAIIKKMGMPVNKLDQIPFAQDTKPIPCLHFPQQAQFHLLKYLQGLVKAITKYGGKIFNHTVADKFQDDIPCVTTTEEGFNVTSKSVIIATCTPVNNRYIMHTKIAPYRTYAIAAEIPTGSVPKGLYWDTFDPFHYVRTHPHLTNPQLEWLIVGGEDHKTGQDSEETNHYKNLEKWAKKLFPMIGSIGFKWSGQVFESIDSLAFIGKNPEDKNTYIATGDSGNGITHGTIAGILIPDLIFKKKNPWEELYKPSRKTFSASLNFLEESFNMALQYKDLFTPGEINEINGLKKEEGKIIRQGLKKLAVYKDNESHVHVNSAFCPHLGACVRWNAGEKSWDCPCHGSRFDGCGKVLTGPALHHLTPQEFEN